MTLCFRINKIIIISSFFTFVFFPVETMRIGFIGASIVPLIIFSTGEYIVNNNDKYTSIWTDTLSKKQIEDLAKYIGISSKIY